MNRLQEPPAPGRVLWFEGGRYIAEFTVGLFTYQGGGATVRHAMQSARMAYRLKAGRKAPRIRWTAEAGQ